MAYLDVYIRRTKKIELGGKEFTFSELSLADFGKFRTRILEQQAKARKTRRDRLLEDAKAIGNVDPLQLLEQLDKPPSEEEIEAQMETTEGIGFLAYLSLKYHYPEINLEEVMQMLTVENITSVGEILSGTFNGEVKKKRTRQPIKKNQ
ncbi:MAG: hypothetical protein CMB80_02665 [Flammeovirgaceae bacterium]|nr:hypothetical protein [Flammeovirgaceae bacterium]|tara:strand:+ start:200 stop:646 length:447 start_codon:yes stop_codon:yes gene_type:complete